MVEFTTIFPHLGNILVGSWYLAPSAECSLSVVTAQLFRLHCITYYLQNSLLKQD